MLLSPVISKLPVLLIVVVAPAAPIVMSPPDHVSVVVLFNVVLLMAFAPAPLISFVPVPLTNVVPAGRVSTTWTLVAGAGPALWTPIV